MNEFFIVIESIFKKFSPYAVGGAVGAIIHRMRVEMTFVAFLKSVVMSVFISVCVGIVCKDYLGVQNDNIIFVFCGLAGTFSKLILDEVEQIIKLASVYAKSKLGILKTKNEDSSPT